MKALKYTVFLVLLLGFACSVNNEIIAQGTSLRFVRFEAGSTVSYGIQKGEKIREIEGDDIFATPRSTGSTFELSEVKTRTASHQNRESKIRVDREKCRIVVEI